MENRTNRNLFRSVQDFVEVSFHYLSATYNKLAFVPLSMKQEGRPNKSFDKCHDHAKTYKVQFHREILSQSLINAALSKPDHSFEYTFGSDLLIDFDLVLVSKTQASINGIKQYKNIIKFIYINLEAGNNYFLPHLIFVLIHYLINYQSLRMNTIFCKFIQF